MKRNSILRGIFWFILAISIIGFVSTNAYVEKAENLDGDKIFEGKTEEQTALEFLEIYSYKYEEQPIISVVREDYTYSIHRADLREKDLETNLYVTFTDLTIGDDGLPTLGLIDVMVYCSTDDVMYGELVGFQRLGSIPGTDVYAHFIDMDETIIERCESNQFTFVADSSRAESEYGLDILEAIPLDELYDVNEVRTNALLELNGDLSDGFSGDITKSSYNVYSIQSAAIAGGITALIVLPIAFGLWYATEREIFETNILKRKKK